MTVASNASQTIAQGNGASVTFAFSFIAVAASDISVTYVDASGNASLLTPSQYTLVINAPATGQLWGVGGTVSYPLSGAAIATGTELLIQRILPYVQTTTISNQSGFYPQVIESALDYITMCLQQAIALYGRALVIPPSDTIVLQNLPSQQARAGKFLYFDLTGQPQALTTAPATQTATIIRPFRSIVAAADIATSLDSVLAWNYTGALSKTQSIPGAGGVVAGYPYTIKDANGKASPSAPITITPISGTIDGAASFPITAGHMSIDLISDGVSQWLIV